MTEQMQAPGEAPRHLTVRQAAFIGVGAMVGAGIFALLGAATVALLTVRARAGGRP